MNEKMQSDPSQLPEHIQSVRPLTTAEQVADHCGLLIVEGRIAAGERLGEERLAEICGVSRGPVREALRILEKRRLIEIIPRRGAFVREVNLHTISDLFNVRNALAAMAAASMASRDCERQETEAFKRLERRVAQIAEIAKDPTTEPLAFSFQVTRFVFATIVGSGNSLLLDIWGELNENTFWTTIWKVPQIGITPEERVATYHQIESIVREIGAGNVSAAEEQMRKCLDDVRDRVLQNLEVQRPSGIR
ncbi:GntR family transcriptional regulator [Sulfitobacter noctilucae]|uniref:GntR family transcriptional regulator n=1 Tax=Sulfitobacter noctilucae TaxID=1342302 RepID=UPI0013770029|nr:GntR family transcriptional regulator [Sulfitobacter noctilucae]